jgi:signal transduction histidine kinase
MNNDKDKIAHVAHQLRNPLNTISINAELARLQLQKQQDPQDVLLSIERILQECKHCALLLDELNPSG